MEHHDAAVRRFVAREAPRDVVLGILLTGSLATGHERGDSDVDLITVVTQEAWRAAEADRRTMYVEHDGAPSPHGYFDVKLTTLEQLRRAATSADEPARSSIGTSRVLYDQGFDLAGLVREVRDGSTPHGAAPAASHLAQARLHGDYFLRQGLERDEPFLAAHAAVHLGLAAGRVVLALERVPYPGPKDLVGTIRALPDGRGEAIADAIQRVAARPDLDAGRHLLALVEAVAGDLLPESATLSTFVRDNELAWFRGTVPPEHW